MPEQIVIFVNKKLFEFSSFEDWKTHASSRYEPYKSIRHALIAVDAIGRVVLSGHEMEIARDTKAFPVEVYLTTDRYGDNF
jgi:hypothetical protein